MEAKAAHSQRSDGSLAVRSSIVRATTPSECSRASAFACPGLVAVSIILNSFRKRPGTSSANARRCCLVNDQIDQFMLDVRLRGVKDNSRNSGDFSSAEFIQ